MAHHRLGDPAFRDVPLGACGRTNALELFQIWLNLPPQSKMVPAHFSMLWGEEIPTVVAEGGLVTVDVIAGALDGHGAPPPPPDSWASHPDSDLAIWLIRVAPGAKWSLPAAPAGVNRVLHCYLGSDVEPSEGSRPEPESVCGSPTRWTSPSSTGPTPPSSCSSRASPLVLPLFQMGPFVMNSAEEIQQALVDYRSTEFGGWPWPNREPVHHRTSGRFALHADGRVEERDRPIRVEEPAS